MGYNGAPVPLPRGSSLEGTATIVYTCQSYIRLEPSQVVPDAAFETIVLTLAKLPGATHYYWPVSVFDPARRKLARAPQPA
jgi:hypothetical protein